MGPRSSPESRTCYRALVSAAASCPNSLPADRLLRRTAFSKKQRNAMTGIPTRLTIIDLRSRGGTHDSRGPFDRFCDVWILFSKFPELPHLGKPSKHKELMVENR